MEAITIKKQKDYSSLGKTIGKSLVKLTIAGIFIGAFHHADLTVATVLGIYFSYALIKKWRYGQADRKIWLIGALVSGLLGVCCELWGIYNAYWEYHDLGNQREFPYWLPFAWALAFTYLYQLEKDLFSALGNPGLGLKIVLALLVAMIFPTLGEIITINLGVWTYSWPYQILGVPLLAIFLLMVFHTGVNLIMTWICLKRGWKNPVYNQ